MKTNINNHELGEVAAIHDQWDAGTIDLVIAGQKLLEQALHNNGDLTLIDTDLATEVLRQAGVQRVPTSPEEADLLITLTFGQRSAIGIPASGTFISFQRQAKWQNPKWISGNRAWKETSRRIYNESGELIDQNRLEEIKENLKKAEKASTLKMEVDWEFIPSPNQVDILRWSSFDNEEGTEVILRTVYIHGIPVHEMLEPERYTKHNFVVPDALNFNRIYDHNQRCYLNSDKDGLFWSAPKARRG